MKWSDLWSELHRYALAYRGDREAALKWLDKFARRVPCNVCRYHWRELVKRHPPDLTSVASFFAWTVERHADVNAPLKKPRMGLDEAWYRASSTAVGDLVTTPPTFPEPPNPVPHVVIAPGDVNAGATSLMKSGYRIRDSVAVVKWDVGGGFTYVD